MAIDSLIELVDRFKTASLMVIQDHLLCIGESDGFAGLEHDACTPARELFAVLHHKLTRADLRVVLKSTAKVTIVVATRDQNLIVIEAGYERIGPFGEAWDGEDGPGSGIPCDIEALNRFEPVIADVEPSHDIDDTLDHAAAGLAAPYIQIRRS